jgi:hypothetical protein
MSVGGSGGEAGIWDSAVSNELSSRGGSWGRGLLTGESSMNNGTEDSTGVLDMNRVSDIGDARCVVGPSSAVADAVAEDPAAAVVSAAEREKMRRDEKPILCAIVSARDRVQ